MSVSQTPSQLQSLLDVSTNPFGEKSTVEFLDRVESETGIWSLHPKLEYIYNLARYEKVNPHGLAVGLYVRTMSHVPPNVVLVGKEGRPRTSLRAGTSLNMGGILVGRTGTNKSNLDSVLDDEMLPYSESITGGTGQGLIKAFCSKVTRSTKVDANGEEQPCDPYDVLVWKRRSVHQFVDEFKFLREEFGRSSSQTLPLLRSMYMGKKAGMENSDQARNATVPQNAARFTSLWSAQPFALDTLMSYYAEGDPQRFTFVPVAEYGHRALIAGPSKRPTYKGRVHPVLYAAERSPVNPLLQPHVGGAQPLWDIYPDEEPYEELTYPTPVWVHWCDTMHTEIPQMRGELSDLITEPYADYFAEDGDETFERELQAEVRSHLILTTIKMAAGITFYIGEPDPRDTATDVYITEVAWEAAKAHMRVSTAELAGCFENARYHLMRERRAAGRGRGMENKFARDEQNALEDTELNTAIKATIQSLARERAKDPNAMLDSRTVQQKATGKHTAASIREALTSLKTPIVLDGVQIVAVETDGTTYRASDALMRCPSIVEYLDKKVPEWNPAQFMPAEDTIPGVDPAAMFSAVVNGAQA